MMKKYRYFLVLFSMMIFGQLHASVYPNYYQSVSISDYLYTPDGGGGGGITISNDVLTVSFSGGWATPQYLKMGVIITLSISPSLPDMELGQVLTSSGFYAGFSAKIQNNSLVIYMGGSPSSMTSSNLYFTQNLGCTSTTWYADNDLDGLGDPLNSVTQCTQPAENWVLNNTDNCPLITGTSANCASLGIVSQDQNYIKTTTYKVASTSSIASPTLSQANQNITYFDGLGRPIQQIANQQSASGKDIVTPIEYDAFGRQSKEYLPYASGSNIGMTYDPAAITNVSNYAPYVGQNPFSEKQFEASPLNRVVKQAAPGSDWKLGTGHEIKFNYQTNITGEVKLYGATAIWNATTGLYNTGLVNGIGTVFYEPYQLYKTITYDENSAAIPIETDGSTVEFKNKQGQVVLKRTYNAGIKHDTYYVYDDYGNLTYVIPPKVEVSITTAILDELCYQYKYDSKNRLAEKKIPGKQWEFIVYDKLDRPIATGPAFSPFTSPTGNGWLITKYDAFGRPVISAWLPSTTVTSAGRKTLQDARDAELTNFSETKIATTANTTINGVAFRYTNAVYPVSGYHVLSVNYFDDYNFPNAPTIPSAVEGQTVFYNTTVKPKGLPTGTWTRVLETSTLYKNEVAYTLYDYKARPIRSYVQNYLGGYTYVDSKLDFTGKPEYTVTKHKLLSTSTELTTKEEFVYTEQGRLLTQTHQINGGAKQLITKNDYDELGQLISKKVGGTDITGATGLQTVNYAYNIRGWLKQINDPNILGTDLFGFKMNYNTVSHGATPLYNGNISETEWKTQNDNVLRWYKYGYDNLNRITSGVDNTADTRYSLTFVDYDKNGNIQHLNRRGQTNVGATTFGVMDQLTYAYLTNSNKLMKVSDAATTDSFGFKDDALNTASDLVDDYTYDANGNMLKDLNKAMTSNILYNHLNLPTKVTFASGNISYIYDATGVKLRKIVSTGTTTDYVGNYVYVNNVLKFFNTAEGYVEPNGGTGYNYVYQYKDHLGNIRLSYSDKNNNGVILVSTDPLLTEIVEENNYYPFGLKHKGYNTNIISEHKYKFNGKELQDDVIGTSSLEMYDYGARNYDPALGRWMNIDPLAETSVQYSPYVYALDNPVFFIDPDGMMATGTIREEMTEEMNPTREYERTAGAKSLEAGLEQAQALEYAKLSKNVYGEGGDTGGYTQVGNTYNYDSGFKAALYKKGSMYVLAIAGTEDLMKDGMADATQILGISAQYEEGLNLATKLLENPKIFGHLTVTGHSLGGGIAEYIAMNKGIHAVTFNAAGVSILTSGIHRNSNTDAYILRTDPLNRLQRASYFLPSAGGRIHYLSPDFNIGSYLNGHSIDHVIESLTPNHYIHDISRAFFRAASRLKL